MSAQALSAGVRNIASALGDMARAHPYRMAVACPAGRDRAGRPAYTQRTFAQLDHESDRLASALVRKGIGPGVRTVLMVKPGLDFFALTFALFKAGAVPVLVDPGMGIRNLGRCLAEAEPEAFLGIRQAQVARKLLGWGKATIRVALTVGGPAGTKALTGDGRVMSATSDRFPVHAPEPGSTAAILFTSGSTGPPKGAVYTHEIFNAQVAMLRDLYAIEPGEVDLCTFPLFALFAPALGMTSVVPEMDATRPAFVDPLKIFEAIESFGVTNMFGSPALLKRVGEYGAPRGVKLPTLKRVVSAGAPVPARVLEQFVRMLKPGVQIFTPYGATESLPVSSIGSDEILGETRHATDLGKGVCVGRPVSGMRVEVIRISDEPIAQWSDELRVPVGEVGEIAVSGPVVTRAYFHRPEATALARIAGPDGTILHRMGDLAYRDGQGRLWFCGRKAHRVVTQTGTLLTIPCEAVFNTHPDVSRTALVGIGLQGEAKPVLCVEPRAWPLSKADRERIVAELRNIGEKFDHTKAIDHFLFRRAFPVDIRHNAKIFREKLAVWAARRVR